MAITLSEEDFDNLELLVENRIADLQLALDDVGWNPLGDSELNDQQELDLDTIKETVDDSRALAIINPLIKRGVSVRSQYVWGNGVKFMPKSGGENLDDSTQEILDDPKLQKYLFSSEAHMEMEKSLATDGNFFFLARGRSMKRYRQGVTKPTGQRIPFHQITGVARNPEDREDIWFYRREWMKTIWNGSTEQSREEKIIEYIPSDLYDPTLYGRPQRIKGHPVRWDCVLIEHSVNKQVGWCWGLPDMLPVLFWAKAHKEFLEDCAKLIKAYSRFAWKATAVTPKGTKATAAKLAEQPTRNVWGDKTDVGNTAVMAAGNNLQPLGRTAGSVDFNAGTPLAGYVAAGLEIPLTDLLSDSSMSNRSSAETLSESKLAAMVSRQHSWSRFFQRLFAYWGKEIRVEWEAIEKDSAFKQIQALVQATQLNVIHDDEARAVLCAVLGLDPERELPTEEELGLLILEANRAAAQAKQSQVADPTDPSYGDNTNRDDAGGQHEYTSDNENPDGQ